MKHVRVRKKRNWEEWYQYFSLVMLFSAIIFGILVVTICLAGVMLWLFIKVGWIAQLETLDPLRVVLLMALFSIIISALLTFFTVKIPLKPVNHIVNDLKRLASGDFSTRLKYGKPISNHPYFKAIVVNFNKMAEELGNTEMLRSDFINNFSHEFKTPIVSIAGFAKLLRHGNLTPEQQDEYLRIIEEESMRLSYMATNVLNLTRIENQSILTDITEYNLSEQIRSCFLILENKWSVKNLELDMDFGEFNITANEELLKQVWINLLDNAIKFTPEFGLVRIEIMQDENQLSVIVSNSGDEIPADKIDKIFNKFYQADESHKSQGNGVGLAVVKKIVDLHKGNVSVQSQNGCTSFTVVLPTINDLELKNSTI